MPQSIPKGLTREHVLKALADLDAGIDHPFGKPTGYELVHEGNPTLFTMLDQATEATPDALPKFDNWQRMFETPPDEAPLPEEQAEPWRTRQGRKIDFVRWDAANHRLGRLGEGFTVELERKRLLGFGRDDLARKVDWVSDTTGDGLGFDVLSFDEVDESEKLIEVKTTTMCGKFFPFVVTANEVRCSEEMAGQYHLYRLFRFTHQPRLYVLHGALSGLCQLDPVQYRTTVAGREAEQHA